MGFPFPSTSQDIRLSLLTHAYTEVTPGTTRLFLRKRRKVGVEKGWGKLGTGPWEKSCVTNQGSDGTCGVSIFGSEGRGRKLSEVFHWELLVTPVCPTLGSTARVFVPHTEPVKSSSHHKILISNFLTLEQQLLFPEHNVFFQIHLDFEFDEMTVTCYLSFPVTALNTGKDRKSTVPTRVSIRSSWGTEVV